MTGKEEWFSFQLSFDLSKATVSGSLTITSSSTFGRDVDASYQTPYALAWIPFVLTAWICALLYKTKFKDAWSLYAITFSRTKKPLSALMGMLIMI